MESVIQKIEAKHKKSAVVDVRSGDSVRVHQKIREAGKERIQIFDGTVIKTNRAKSLLNSFTVRKVASGVGVEKTFFSHSPVIIKVEVTKRSKVRRNYLSYMRGLAGKGSRLSGIEFDRDEVNAAGEAAAEAEEAKIKEEQAEQHEAEAAEKAEAAAKDEAKVEAAIAKHDTAAKPDSAKPEDQPKPKTDTQNSAEPQAKAEK